VSPDLEGQVRVRMARRIRAERRSRMVVLAAAVAVTGLWIGVGRDSAPERPEIALSTPLTHASPAVESPSSAPEPLGAEQAIASRTLPASTARGPVVDVRISKLVGKGTLLEWDGDPSARYLVSQCWRKPGIEMCEENVVSKVDRFLDLRIPIPSAVATYRVEELAGRAPATPANGRTARGGARAT